MTGSLKTEQNVNRKNQDSMPLKLPVILSIYEKPTKNLRGWFSEVCIQLVIEVQYTKKLKFEEILRYCPDCPNCSIGSKLKNVFGNN